MEIVIQRLCLSWCRTPWATTDPTSGGRGEESGLREAVLGFWVAPGHLDCGRLRALLWSLCFTQVVSVPRADTSLSSQVLLLPVVPWQCKALTAASPHHQRKTFLIPTLLTLLHVVCFVGCHEAGEDLQHSAFCVAWGGQSSAAQ